MPPVLINNREQCAMLDCKKRLVKGKTVRVGATHLLSIFREFVGPEWDNYTEQSEICPKCSVMIKNTMRQETLSIPGTRSYRSRNIPPQAHGSPESMDVDHSEHSVDDNPCSSSAVTSQPSTDPEDSSDRTSDSDGRLEMSEGSQVNVSSHQSSNQPPSSTDSQRSTSTSASQNVEFADIRAVISTQSRCFICGNDSTSTSLGRSRIPASALRIVWDQLGIFIPLQNRCCGHHLDAIGFTAEALNLIKTTTATLSRSKSSLYAWIKAIMDCKDAPGGLFEFSDGGVKPKDYPDLLGVSKENFEDLLTYIQAGTMRNTEQRSTRNALAMFLMTIKGGYTQDHLAYCFQVEQKIVSNAINSITEALGGFSTQNLGPAHLSQEDYLQHHDREAFRTALSLEEDSMLVIADGTYVYIEKPSDIEEQRVTFSGQKMRNFLRYMFLVLPSGHILDVFGPFPATQGDADVIGSCISDELMEFLGPSPNLLVDRGFKRCRAMLESKGFNVFEPSWIPKDATQLTTEEGNKSRLVTLCRWIVEATFGRLKQKFKFFMNKIHGRYSKDKITKMFRIACGILNKYFPIGFKETPANIQHAATAAQRSLLTENDFQKKLEEDGVLRLTRRWRKITEDSITDFPHLTLEDLETVTLGPYQPRIAKMYIREHLKPNGTFEMRFSEDHAEEGYVRAQLHSRFSSRKTHSAFVKYNSEIEGPGGIIGYYCTCRAGARLVGCCAHISSIIRYLSCDRFLESTSGRKVNRGEFFAGPQSAQSSESMDVSSS